MIVQRAHNIKNQKHGQIKVSVNWKQTEEVSPAFKRLMRLLLQAGNETKGDDRDDRHKL